MRGFTNTVIVGNVTKDLELKNTKSGMEVTSLTIAVNDKNDSVSYIDCTAFGKTAETLAKYVKKGDPLLVQGSLKQSTWEKDGEKRSKLEVMVSSFSFIGGKKETKDTAPDDIDEKPLDLSEIPF